MAELKTQKNKASVKDFINTIESEEKRKDSKELVKIFKAITKKNPVMWGTSIIGFDQYHYKPQRSKQEGDWPMTGFSPRKQNLSIYIMPGFKNKIALLKKLGKHKTSVSCLYIKRLSDINIDILKKVIETGYKEMKERTKNGDTNSCGC